ncbi:hypothetical protein GIB67_036740 [Kingdonia uniflora]|uniref:Uncharacterized protein n=1 Tax=Kingdonia uniflora TaxID=39325 RepID=A0A7J7LWI3_9MAGN|nr:hypothetical protein GIB67_036740 [Kingdonia uniflora]
MERFFIFEQDFVYSNNLPQRDFKLGKFSSIQIGFLYIRITHFGVISSLILFE